MQDKQDFIFSFFPFMFGIYPHTVVTEKQREAMTQAKVNYVYMSIYEITYAEVKNCWAYDYRTEVQENEDCDTGRQKNPVDRHRRKRKEQEQRLWSFIFLQRVIPKRLRKRWQRCRAPIFMKLCRSSLTRMRT